MNSAVLLALLVLAAGVVILIYAHKLSKQIEHHSRVVYSDGVKLRPANGISGESLVSRKYGITGKPDQIIIEGGHYIPVELKSSRRPRRPYRGHVLQLAAYCLILEEVTGRPVPYGYLQYRDGEPFKIAFDDLLREELLRTVEEMRQVMAGSPVRKADNPNKFAEFVANIFDHSLSDRGYVFAQYYPIKGYLDMCVLDRGRGLRRSYKEEKNRDYTPLEAIQRALAGESTKKEDYRGTGIPTSQKVICKGLNGKMAIISESAAAIITRNPTFFNILDFSWKGTIVSFRIPKPEKPIDIYKLLRV